MSFRSISSIMSIKVLNDDSDGNISLIPERLISVFMALFFIVYRHKDTGTLCHFKAH